MGGGWQVGGGSVGQIQTTTTTSTATTPLLLLLLRDLYLGHVTAWTFLLGRKATSSVPRAYLSPLEAWLNFDDPKLSQIISTRPSPRLLAPRTAHNFGVPSPRPRGTSLIPFRGRAREPHSISRKTFETN